MIKHLLWNASARCYGSTAICSQRRTRHFDAQSNLRFRLYIKPSNRINLVILNPKSKLRETLSICAKYKTIKSLRSTMRQVNDAPSKQRNSAKTKYMNNLWSHGAGYPPTLMPVSPVLYWGHCPIAGWGLIPRIFTFPVFRIFHNSKRTQHFQFDSTVFVARFYAIISLERRHKYVILNCEVRKI